MVGFSKKEIICDDSIGYILHDRRQKLGLKLEPIAEKIKIAKNYLSALESNDFQSLPGEVYAVNFIKKYAEFLKIDSACLVEKFRQDKTLRFKDKNLEENKKKYNQFNLNAKILRFGSIIFIALVIVGYLVTLIYKTIAPPEIMVQTPTVEAVVSRQQIKISGLTDEGSEVKINGQDVKLIEDGHFEHEIYLAQGLNEIEIKAKKKYSRENLVVHKVMYLKN